MAQDRTNLGIHFAHAASSASDEHLPGYYLHVAPGASSIAAGSWRPSSPGLKRIRDAIAAKDNRWGKLPKVARPSDGESSRRIPPGYDSSHRFADDLRRKDFYATVPFSDAAVTSSTFDSRFLAACRKLAPLNEFLADALSVPW